MAKDGMDVTRQIEAEKELFKALREKLRQKPHLISTSINFDNLVIQTSISQTLPLNKTKEESADTKIKLHPLKARIKHRFPQLSLNGPNIAQSTKNGSLLSATQTFIFPNQNESKKSTPLPQMMQLYRNLDFKKRILLRNVSVSNEAKSAQEETLLQALRRAKARNCRAIASMSLELDSDLEDHDQMALSLNRTL